LVIGGIFRFHAQKLPCKHSHHGFRYQRAYVDFFEDELVSHGYDWHKVVERYIFSGKEPLINCMVAGRKS
jgi:hypothetical protein